MLIIENSSYENHIRYAAKFLLRNIDTSDVYIYYGKKRPANFKGLFLLESNFWANYNKAASLPTEVIKTKKKIVLYGSSKDPDIIAGSFALLSGYLENYQLQDRQDVFKDLWPKINIRPVVDEYEKYLLEKLRAIYPEISRKTPERAVILTHVIKDDRRSESDLNSRVASKILNFLIKIYQQTFAKKTKRALWLDFLRYEFRSSVFIEPNRIQDKELLLQLLENEHEPAYLMNSSRATFETDIKAAGFMQSKNFVIDQLVDKYDYYIPYSRLDFGYSRGSVATGYYFSLISNQVQPILQIPIQYRFNAEGRFIRRIYLLVRLQWDIKKNSKNGGLITINIDEEFLSKYWNRIIYRMIIKTINRTGLEQKKLEDLI